MPPPVNNPLLQQQLAQMQLQSLGLGSADVSGLMDANLKMNLGMAGIGAVSAIPSLQQNIQQNKLLKQLQKEGPQDVTPQAFKEYQAFLQNQANNAQIAGYGTALENINRAQAAGLGNVYKASINPAQALRGALALNQQGIAARNQLAMQGAQAQQTRQNAANQAMLQRGQFQEQGRQEYDKAVSALRGAKAQNWNNFVQGLTGAALNSFVMTPNKKKDVPAVPPGGATSTTTATGTGTTTGTGATTGTAATATIPTTGEQYQYGNYANFVGQVAPKVLPGFAAKESVPGSSIINPEISIAGGNPMRQFSGSPLTGGKTYVGFDGAPVSEQYARSLPQAPADQGTAMATGTGPNQAVASGANVTPVVATGTGPNQTVASGANVTPVVATGTGPNQTVASGAATTNAGGKPEINNNLYTKPYEEVTADGGKTTYKTDGMAEIVDKDGKKYTASYTIGADGRATVFDKELVRDLTKEAYPSKLNGEEAYKRANEIYEKDGKFPETAGTPPVKNEVYTETVVRKDVAGRPVVYGTDGFVRQFDEKQPDKIYKRKYYVRDDGFISPLPLPEELKDKKEQKIDVESKGPAVGSEPPKGLDYKLGAQLEPNQTFSVRPVKINEKTNLFERPYLKPFKIGTSDAEIAFDTKGRFTYTPSPGSPPVVGTYTVVDDKAILSLYDANGKVTKSIPADEIINQK